MTALVTGGGGFIGRYVVAALRARGEAVRVLGRNDYPDLGALGVDCRRGDVADAHAVRAACAGVNTVYHVAALAGVHGRYETFYRANVTGTRNVVEACRAAGIGRLVLTSSPSVVFDGRSHAGADEGLPYPRRYESAYAETKAIAERLVLAADGPTLATVSLRPHLVFGPGDNHLVPRLVDRARRGRVARVGAGDNRVDLSYVEDVARAHLLAADALAQGSTARGRAFFITQGEPVVLWQWIDDLLAALDLPPVRRTLSLRSARRIGALLEWAYRAARTRREPPLTRFVASQLALDHHYDIGAARRILGYVPATDMKSATARTVAALRDASGEAPRQGS